MPEFLRLVTAVSYHAHALNRVWSHICDRSLEAVNGIIYVKKVVDPILYAVIMMFRFLDFIM